MTTFHTAIIGAGPSGLAAARALSAAGLTFTGFEASSGVGGLWDIANPRSSMYESAHLISSRTTTEFAEFPMRSRVDYPGHAELKTYFQEYADHFDLEPRFRFNTRVDSVVRAPDGRWAVTTTESTQPTDADPAQLTEHFDHVIIATGTLATPSIPSFEGTFTGEIMHTHAYKRAEIFAGKRVLVVGAGNSGCDIAVDAIHHAQSVDISVRRGYYFVPRYIFGRPSDTLNQRRPLPPVLKQAFDTRLLRAFTGDPVRFGFPKPDYKIYESHPVVNTLILGHLGQGDLRVQPDIARFDGNTVHFRDGSSADYDLIMLATGYTLDYPFIDRAELNWTGAAPKLYLNMFPPQFNGISVLGMVEAVGLGWQGRYEQAVLLAQYLLAEAERPALARAFRDRAAGPWPDLTGGYNYLMLERMSYYVNKDAYRRRVRAETAKFAPR